MQLLGSIVMGLMKGAEQGQTQNPVGLDNSTKSANLGLGQLMDAQDPSLDEAKRRRVINSQEGGF